VKLSKTVVKVFASKVLNTVIGFGGLAFVARELGSSSLGVYFLFMSVLGILSLVADFGIREGVTKLLSQQPDNNRRNSVVIGTAALLKLGPIAIVVAVILLFRTQLSNYIGANVIYLLVIAIILQEVYLLVVFILRGELEVGQSATLQATNKTLSIGCGALLVAFGFGTLGMVYGVILGFILTSCWGLVKIESSVRRPEMSKAANIFNYSKYSFISSIGGRIFGWADVLVIGFILSQAAVGAYEIAWRVGGIAILFSQAVTTTLFPEFSRLDSSSDTSKIQSLISSAIVPLMMTIVPAFVGTLFLSEEMLTVLFGAEYAVAKLVLVIHIGTKVMQSLHMLFAKSLRAMNFPDLAARSRVVGILSNVGLNLVFVYFFGIVGAAVATSISITVNLLMNYHYLRRFISIDIPKRSIFWVSLSSLLMGIWVLFIKQQVVTDSPVKLGAIILSAVVVYSVLIFASSEMRRQIRELAAV